MFRVLKRIEENVSLSADFPLEIEHYKNDFSFFQFIFFFIGI